MARKLRKNRLDINNHRLSLLVLALLVVVLILSLLVHSHKTKISTIPTTSPAKTTTAPSNSATNNSSSPQPNLTNSSKPAASSVSDSTQLIAPYGTFVSNHHPSLSDPNQLAETSVCNSTPGATCQIEFVKGSNTQKLTPQTLDSSGSTYWYWNIKTAGLSEGHWNVVVSASLNGKTLTANDTLDIQP